MRTTASILHLDLDAFFAAVEQRDKPSLRGRPVVVGGLGPRGVVSTASYEARRHGVRSAMRMVEARALCPHAAFLSGRFDAYRSTSRIVMTRLRAESALVEPLSLDEAFVDLDDGSDLDEATLRLRAERLRADIFSLTGGLTASVGLASSKLVAKIASDLDKPDGLVLVRPGTEVDLLGPMPLRAIPGVGPATFERLRRLGLTTVEQAREQSRDELMAILGQASGASLYRLVRADDDRPVDPSRETKSISAEETFETDVTDRAVLRHEVTAQGVALAGRLRAAQLSARTVTLKVRHHDFETHTRSTTLSGPTDDATVVTDLALGLLDGLDLAGGVRLIGVGVSGLTTWTQPALFSEQTSNPSPSPEPVPTSPRHGPVTSTSPTWSPGADIHHREHGDGWVWGSGLGRVTIRFETRSTPAGPVRTFAADDPDLLSGHRDAPDETAAATVGP